MLATIFFSAISSVIWVSTQAVGITLILFSISIPLLARGEEQNNKELHFFLSKEREVLTID